MKARREFVKRLSAISAGLMLFPAFKFEGQLIETNLSDLENWDDVAKLFSIDNTTLNLNNAGLGVMPNFVRKKWCQRLENFNSSPALKQNKALKQNYESLKGLIGSLLGVGSDDIAIQRNATEALVTAFHSVHLKKGDHVVLCRQDYPVVVNTLRHLSSFIGIELSYVDINFEDDTDETIIRKYSEEIRANTRLVHITHMINWNGMILPVKKIIKKVKSKSDAFVVVDGAQTVGQIDFNLKDLNADIFASSLHKWFHGPFGTGLLYFKDTVISKLRPLFPGEQPNSSSIEKFERLGTYDAAAVLSLKESAEFNFQLKIQRKHSYLFELKSYLESELIKTNFYTILTPSEIDRSAGIIAFKPKKGSIGNLYKFFNKRRILVSIIVWENLELLRASPNIYHSKKDLNRFVSAIQEYAGTFKP